MKKQFMNLRNLKIRTRLIIGFGMVLLFSGLIGVISLINFQKSSNDLKSLYLHPLTVSNTVRDININIISIHRAMKDVALATNDREINNLEILIRDYEKDTYALFDVVFDRFLGDKKDITRAYQLFKQWKPIREEVIALWHENNKEGAALITKGKGAVHVANILSSVDVMIAFATNKGDEFYSLTQSNVEKTYNTLFYLIFLVIVLSVTIAMTITQSISKAIRDLNRVSNKIQSGDYTIRNSIKSSDELSQLAGSFNKMADAIESKNIINNGVAEISSSIMGKESIEDFASSLLAVFMKKTKTQMATFHLLNADKSEFDYVVSIGANKSVLRSFSAEYPEGEFGNACAQKKIYHLKKVPDNTIFNYNTVAGNAIPKEIVTIPIIVNSEVIALISLVNLDVFTPESCEIITRSTEALNASFATIFANEQAKKISKKLVVSNQQLEAQSEELQEQAEELLNQTNELRISSEELNEQNVELQMQRSQVEEANRLKSEFLSNMSHELRTPLNSINALSKVLMLQSADKLSVDENKYLEIIERNGKRLLTLINDILDLSKIEAGKMEVEMYPFALKPSIELITENLKALAYEKGIQLNLEIADGIPPIETDENKLHQVLTNVIGNAIKFTQEGTVNVCASIKQENVVITVQDTGIGVNADILPFIFNEFRQEDGSTSRSFEGTGLGLAITNKIMHALNGEILVKSKKGIGSTFTIILPIKSTKEVTPNIETVKTPTVLPKKKLILVVDDGVKSVQEISRILEDRGYQTIGASTGKDALRLAEKHQPAVILDLMMSETDDFELLNGILNEEATRNIPVIVVTTKDLTSDKKEELQGKARAVLIKEGLHLENLLLELKRVLTNNANEKLGDALGEIDRKKRLLIIEDSEAAIIQIQKVLAHENVIVDFVMNGKEAMEYVSSTIPDGIILDLMMPEMDGFEILDEIRGSAETKNIPVLILTAKTLTKSDLSKLSSNNVAQLIQKGDVNVEELLSKINAMLGTHIIPTRSIEKISTNSKRSTIIPLKVHKGKKPTIVLVEDNLDNRITAKAILSDKFTIIEAVDGEEGLKKIAFELPDLVLLDISLPKKDGLEVVKSLKENDKTKGIPVIALTAKAMKRDREVILEAGCDEYVSKPIDVIELRSKIAQFIKCE